MKRFIAPLFLPLFSFFVVFILSLLFPSSLQDIELKSVDYRFRLREAVSPSPNVSEEIVHIDIDDSSIERLGRWPWRRVWHAKLIDILSRCGVKTIGYDVIFAHRSTESDDNRLILSTKEAGNVCFPVGFELSLDDEEEASFSDQEKAKVESIQKFAYRLPTSKPPTTLHHVKRVLAPLAPLSKYSAGIGHISATPDKDGVFRRIPMLIEFNNKLFPSLSLQIVCNYLGIKEEKIDIIPGKQILLKDVRLPGSTKTTDIAIPIDKKGEMMINFGGKWGEIFQHFSFIDIVEWSEEVLDYLAIRLKDKIVIVGTTFSGGTDIGPTPLETQFPLSEIHSHAVNTILTQKFIHPLPSWVGMLIVLLLTLLIGRLSLRFKPLLFAGLSFLVLISFLGGTFILFMSKGYLVNVTHPFLGILLCYSSITLYKYTTEEIEKKRLKQVFQRYVSHQVMEMILNNPEEVSLGGRRKELTILFADIKDFTKYSDGVEPEEVVEFLTEYFDRMTEIIFEYGGTVDKLIGDGILAFFGDPVSYTDHAQRAVSAGLKMRQSLRDISKKRVNEGKMPLEVRIGINTGYVTVGNMGSDRFMDYTVIGNNVNLAARLEQAAAPGQIIVSHRTYSLIKNKIKTNFVGEISLKGLGEEKIYEVIE